VVEELDFRFSGFNLTEKLPGICYGFHQQMVVVEPSNIRFFIESNPPPGNILD